MPAQYMSEFQNISDPVVACLSIADNHISNSVDSQLVTVRCCVNLKSQILLK
jgi:hypothetical protein